MRLPHVRPRTCSFVIVSMPRRSEQSSRKTTCGASKHLADRRVSVGSQQCFCSIEHAQQPLSRQAGVVRSQQSFCSIKDAQRVTSGFTWRMTALTSSHEALLTCAVPTT